jgi:hypothetical protein
MIIEKCNYWITDKKKIKLKEIDLMEDAVYDFSWEE